MRTTLFAIACLGLLLSPIVSAAPSVPEPVQDALEDKQPCFLILARPYETPEEAVAGWAGFVLCLATA